MHNTIELPQRRIGPSLKRMGRIHCLFYLNLALLLGTMVIQAGVTPANVESLAALTIASVLMFWVPAVVVLICRVRDLDFPSWTVILLLMPLLGALFFLLILSLPGTAGGNRHGEAPPAPKRWITVLALLLSTVLIVVMLAGFCSGVLDGFHSFA